MKKWIVLTVVAASVAGVAIAEAGPKKGQGPKGDRDGGITKLLDKPHVLKKLGITDEQVDALKESSYQSRKDMIAMKAERDTARLDLRQLMDADKIDEASVIKAVESVGALETELHKARVKNQLNTIEILGKDTYDQLKAMKQRMRRAQHDGKRGGKQNRRGGVDRKASVEDGDSTPWTQDEMLPPDDEV